MSSPVTIPRVTPNSSFAVSVPAAHEHDEVLQVHDAQHVVDRLAVDRHARVAVLHDLLEQLARLVLHGEGHDLGAGHHDLLDGHLGSLRGGADDREGGAFVSGPVGHLARQAEHLLRGARETAFARPGDPPDRRLDHTVEDRVNGPQDLVKNVEREPDGSRHAARMRGRHGLGEHLAEHEHQGRHDDGRDRNAEPGAQVVDGEGGGHRSAEDVHDVVPEQDRDQQVRGRGHELPDRHRRGLPRLLDLFLDLLGAQAQERRLAAREDRGQDEADEEHEQIGR
jgi:hypothetical protein